MDVIRLQGGQLTVGEWHQAVSPGDYVEFEVSAWHADYVVRGIYLGLGEIPPGDPYREDAPWFVIYDGEPRHVWFQEVFSWKVLSRV